MSVLVWGHRGHRHWRIPYLYPGAVFENSLAACIFAMQHADGFECDVIRSADGTAWLGHDIDTLSDGSTIYEMDKNLNEAGIAKLNGRKIYDIHDDEIAPLTLKDNQPIPKLEDILSAMKDFPGRSIVIELKGPHSNEPALSAVDNAIAEKWIVPEQVIFSSFNLPALVQLRQHVGTRFKIGALFDMDILTLTQMYPGWENAPQDAFYVPFRLDAGILDLPCLHAMQPDYFHIECRSMSDNALAQITEKFPQAKIILWTSGEMPPDEDPILPELIRRYAPTGKLHAVITDFPEALRSGSETLAQE